MAADQTAVEELEGLLPQAVEIVLQWIRQGEKADCKVSPWRNNDEARATIKLDLPDDGVNRDVLLSAISDILTHSVNPWTGRFLDKLYAAPHPIGLVAELLLSALNANAHVMSASPLLTLCEEKCVAALANTFGYSEDVADGLTLPGGSASNTLALQTALATTFPSFKTHGIIGVMLDLQTHFKCPPGSRPIIFTSEQSHYSLDKAAISCGLGLVSLKKIACDSYGRMCPQALDEAFSEARADPSAHGFPFFINATSGSTVLGSFDDLNAVAKICDRYQPVWLHVDASWGGPVIFSSKWKHLMQGVERTNSVTINPHKLLNVPLQASFLVVQRGMTLRSNALGAAYLFHDLPSSDQENGSALHRSGRCDDAALKTMGCGRRGDALKFYLAWLKYGRNGFAKHVDQGFDLARQTVQYIQQNHATSLEVGPMPETLFLQVCFRPRISPTSDSLADIKRSTELTKLVHSMLRRRRRFAVDFAPLPNGVGDFIRLVTHPRTEFDIIRELVDEVANIGQELMKGNT